MNTDVDESWRPFVRRESEKEYFRELSRFVDGERAAHQVYPADADVFRAFRMTPFGRAKVVILGQDPYHGEGQAHGLSFSVPSGIQKPPSLENIFKELSSDRGCAVPSDGDLSFWAAQGIFLLNTILTVRAGEPASHRGRGWDIFTDAVISELSEKKDFLVFILWGAHAQKKACLIDTRHRIISSAHPSPLSAYRGFFGSRPFSAVNDALSEKGIEPVSWEPGSFRQESP